MTGTAQENGFSDEESCLDVLANDNETLIADLNSFIEAGDITKNNNVFNELNRILRSFYYLLKIIADPTFSVTFCSQWMANTFSIKHSTKIHL